MEEHKYMIVNINTRKQLEFIHKKYLDGYDVDNMLSSNELPYRIYMRGDTAYGYDKMLHTSSDYIGAKEIDIDKLYKTIVCGGE